ncbi:MAG: hypothetical protein ACK55I_45655, partial [bacterium]
MVHFRRTKRQADSRKHKPGPRHSPALDGSGSSPDLGYGDDPDKNPKEGHIKSKGSDESCQPDQTQPQGDGSPRCHRDVI